MKYKAYPKRAIIGMICGDKLGAGKNVFEMWEAGAKEIEKTSPGKIITAPIRLPAALVSASEKTVEQVPSIVKTVSRTIPVMAVAAVLIGAGYLVYKIKFEKGNVKKSVDENYPE